MITENLYELNKSNFEKLHKLNNEKLVFLDTNAFFVPYNSNFDFLGDIKAELGNCIFVLFNFVVEELESIITISQSKKNNTNLFLPLLNLYKSKFLLIETDYNYGDKIADDLFIKLFSETNFDFSKSYLFTTDSGLKRNVRDVINIISIRQNKKIHFE